MEDDKLKTIGYIILIIIIVVVMIIISKHKHIEYKCKGWYEVTK